MGVIFPTDRYQRYEDLPPSLDSELGSIVALLRPNESGLLRYYAFSLWGDAVDGLGAKDELMSMPKSLRLRLTRLQWLKLSSEASEKEAKAAEEGGGQGGRVSAPN